MAKTLLAVYEDFDDFTLKMERACRHWRSTLDALSRLFENFLPESFQG